MYKVNIKKNRVFASSRYFDNRKDAVAFRETINLRKGNGLEAALQSRQVNVRYHHRSLAKGYVAKGLSYDEYYDGKFGVGFKRHIENCKESVSNSYHYVDYYVEY